MMVIRSNNNSGSLFIRTNLFDNESACKYLIIIKYVIKFHVGIPTQQTLQQYARTMTQFGTFDGDVEIATCHGMHKINVEIYDTNVNIITNRNHNDSKST